MLSFMNKWMPLIDALMLSTFLSVIHHMEGPMKSIQQQELISDNAAAQFPGVHH